MLFILDGDTDGTSPEDNSSDNVIKVYYNTDNDRLYHGNELQYLEVDGDVSDYLVFIAGHYVALRKYRHYHL